MKLLKRKIKDYDLIEEGFIYIRLDYSLKTL